jgi:DDE superfamily endonuclease
MEEVLDAYERPYKEDYPLVGLDETRKQLVSETISSFTDEHGVQYVDYEYKREGVADVYMVVEPLAGKREVFIKDDHSAQSWAQVVTFIAEQMYPAAKKITIVQDNLSAHARHALYELHPPQKAREILQRMEFIHTPKHGSWLNVAEIELSILSRQCLSERIPDKETLQQQVQAWQDNRNNRKAYIDWQFTTKDARIKLKRLYPKL